MVTRRLKEFLDRNGIAYETIPHRTTYTAQRTAQATHIPGKDVAKTVVVKVDGRLILVALPASEKVDLDQIRDATEANRVELAAEDDFRDAFPGCEVGAMPPFGNLYDMEVWVDGRLAEDEKIAFNAGSHDEMIRVRYQDFDRLVRPRVLALAAKR
jgi:Ala-tRNA(Pro) deacylase